MERTKRISSQTLAIAILSLLLVASLLMTATGAWFTSTLDDTDAGYAFGTIKLGALGYDEEGNVSPTGEYAKFAYELGEPSTDVIMPGDSIAVDFNLVNDGTADMWVRFKLAIVGEENFETNLADQLDTETYYQSGEWVYLIDALIGSPTVANGSHPVSVLFEIDEEFDNQEAGTISFTLDIEAVQVANNDGPNGPAVLGWPS